MKLFITYWLLSGIWASYFAYKNYDKMVDAIPFFSIISKEFLTIAWLFTGFIHVPFTIPLMIRNAYYSNKLKKLQIKKQEEKKYIEFLREKYKHCFIEEITSSGTYIDELSNNETTVEKYKDAFLVAFASKKRNNGPTFFILIKGRYIKLSSSFDINQDLSDGWKIELTFNNPDYKEKNGV